MKIQLLGTGAADGIPSFYGDCPVCRHAREHGGKDVRTRSSAIIDGILKLDLPPDTLMQLQRERLSARDWSALLITHSDEDHFAVDQLQYALHPFTEMEYLGFTVYANPTVVDSITGRYPEWPMDVVATRSFCQFQHAGYVITPIRARHGCPTEDAQNFVIERDGKCLIYATDTGIWPEETWMRLRDFEADALVIECTDGFNPPSYEGHLNIEQCVQVVERLRKQGTLKPQAKVATTHHGHNGDATHEQLEAALAPHGIVPGYDGMILEIS